METTLNYILLWQNLHQIVLSELYETVDKLASCYQIFEPQAVAAVIPQKGNKSSSFRQVGNSSEALTLNEIVKDINNSEYDEHKHRTE